MKKRILTMLLALVMVISLLPVYAMAAPSKCNHYAHGFNIEKAEGDCKTESAINYICKKCGTLTMSITQGFGDHKYGADSKCTVCGKVCKNHQYGYPVTVEPTCTEDGSVTRICNVCGHKDVKTLKSDGHKFTIYVHGRASTCTVEGYTAHKRCFKCNEPNKDYAVIAVTGHDYKVIKDETAGCTKDGLLWKVCKNCGDEIKETRKAGHSYTDVDAKEPTCTEGGHNAYQQCSKCGHKKGYVPSYAKGHTYVNGICACGATASDYTGPSRPGNPWCTHPSKSTYTTSPDCTVVGYTVVTCNTCHAEISREIEPAKGHDTQTTTVEPTCTTDGYVKETCKVCKAQTSYQFMERLGHNYVNGICTRCGIGKSDITAPGKTYSSDLQNLYAVGGTAY